MKKVGRVLLLIVGIVMLAMAIPSIINLWQQFQTAGDWSNPFTWGEKWPIVPKLVGQALTALAGVLALGGALVGKKSHLLAMAAIILVIPPIISLVGDINSGAFVDWTMTFWYIGTFILPVGYFVGFLLL